MTPANVSALAELWESLKLWPLWTYMSWQDIRQRYRGSLLGPFWVAGGIGAASLGAGLLYSQILKTDARQLIPYTSLSIGLWTLMSLTLTEACHAFIGVSLLVHNMALPRPVHIFRVVSRNLIVFAHGLVVVALVFLLMGRAPASGSALSLVGLALMVFNLTWSSWVLALLSARFRDVVQVTFYALQFAIFVTPIFWYARMAGPKQVVLFFNPFYHLMETVRGPILGYAPTVANWEVSIGLAIVGTVVGVATFVRFRHDIAFWV